MSDDIIINKLISDLISFETHAIFNEKMASSVEDNVTKKAISHDDNIYLDSIIADIFDTIVNNVTDHGDETVETVIADVMELVQSVCGSSAD